MKNRVLAFFMAAFVVLFSTNALAASAWLQTNEEYTEGQVESEVTATAINGTATLTSGNEITDPSPINRDPVEFTFTADPGFELFDSSNSFVANDPTQEGYYYSAEMRAEWPGAELYDAVTPNLDDYYDLVINEVSSTNTELVLSVNVVRNEVVFEEEIMIAHLEPELSVEITVVFREEQTPPPPPPPVFYYNVTAVSNPAGVATFDGTGDAFVFGQNYSVDYTQVDDEYVFVGWTGVPSGTISGNVALVANFEPVVEFFDVTATSQPAGVATFDGTGTDIEDGSAYNVSIASVVDGYEFVEWIGVPSGTIDGADVAVIAVFEEVIEEILDEEIAEEIPDEELPEAGGIPGMAFTFVGAAISFIGKRLRK